ncbi:hypothetical protein E3N88_45830 [Mikania micrantha]|uniref:Dof-type domain-containing protein n=1 Tax=Mikania micrantha TaxID=192012 RepID=A0A5N6L823_9ASTR|nr:hypothetical protein E3N88_45830 [Mikania micrantha]
MEDPGIKLFGKQIVLPGISKNFNLPVTSSAAGEEAESASGVGDKDTGSDNTLGHTSLEDEKENRADAIKPRHFCKSCQRYWTAGGAMRNMAVGAGRRKNKNLANHSRCITISQETVTTCNSAPENLQNGFHSQVHSFPKVSWPYIPVPTILPPMPIHPSTYWNCIPFLPPSTPTITDSVLGKRSRNELLISNDCDGELKKQKNKNSILIPKTLRIDDPDEAARSSIWATLGIKNENFKAFQEKSKESKKHQDTTTPSVLQANPAAFSRSICFQETA